MTKSIVRVHFPNTSIILKPSDPESAFKKISNQMTSGGTFEVKTKEQHILINPSMVTYVEIY